MEVGWSVPQSLKTVRKRQGLTQAQVAERMGLTTSAYQHYEGGRSEPKMSDVMVIARAMGCSPCDFFDPAADRDSQAARARELVEDWRQEEASRLSRLRRIHAEIGNLIEEEEGA